MDRRLQVIRFWELAIGILLVAWWWPPAVLWLFGGMSFTPLALMMPPLFPTATCVNCSGDIHDEYQVDITGLIDGACTDCTDYNTSFVTTFLTDDDGGGRCEWSFTIPSPPCAGIDKVNFFVDGSQLAASQISAGTDFNNITKLQANHGSTTCDDSLGPDSGVGEAAIGCGGNAQMSVTPL